MKGVSMCTAIREMMEDSKSEGRMEMLERQVQAKLARNESIEKIADDLVESVEVIQQIVKKLQ